MFYRRNILLSLLQIFDNRMEKLKLQKLLFLFSYLQEKPDFHFIPYKFGCYSFRVNADLLTMTKYKQVKDESKHWLKIDKIDYVNKLKEQDKHILLRIKNDYGNMSLNKLIKFVYTNYPYYAINSMKAESLLDKKEYRKVLNEKPNSNNVILYTIGYEGISIEEYLNRLIRNDIKVLCDVRKNPVSMKYGFSKKQLSYYCEQLNISYLHFPELGINSNKRQSLNDQSDYDLLFEDYKENTLTETRESQLQILELLKEKRRIALTCFESDTSRCHRTHLANSLKTFRNWKYQVKHI